MGPVARWGAAVGHLGILNGMEPTPELIEALQREEIQDARRLSVARKLELSGDLFDYACQITLGGIQMQNPGIGLDEAYAMLRGRLELGRKLEKIKPRREL